jgi:hypothetical protein
MAIIFPLANETHELESHPHQSNESPRILTIRSIARTLVKNMGCVNYITHFQDLFNKSGLSKDTYHRSPAIADFAPKHPAS